MNVKPTRRTFVGMLCSIPFVGMVIPKKAIESTYEITNNSSDMKFTFKVVVYSDRSKDITLNDIKLVPVGRSNSFTHYGIGKGKETSIACDVRGDSLVIDWFKVIQNRETGEFL